MAARAAGVAARGSGRGPALSAPDERQVRVGGEAHRVWEKGRGEPLGFLGGFRGLPRWPAFLDRLAERRRVVAPSLPGFPGARGHDRLDDLADWVTATLDLLEESGLEGADLVGALESAPLAVAAEVIDTRRLDRHGFAGTLRVETSLTGGAAAGRSSAVVVPSA